MDALISSPALLLASLPIVIFCIYSGKMATILKHTAFQPLFTGPLLYVLTRGSPELRARLLEPLSSLPFNLESPGFIKALKWAFGLGLFSRVNGFLNQWAQNCWSLGDSGGKPWDWPNEIMAVTGGSGGLGSECISICAKTGMKIAIMDVSPPGPKLQARRTSSIKQIQISANPTL